MLARVMDTYAQYGHPDEDVALTAEAREALRALTLDPDAQVRLSACEACRYDEELAALLDDRVGEHTAGS
jgi:hypothetical protein